MLTDRGRRISVCNASLEYSNRRKSRRDNSYGLSEGCRDWSPSRSSSSSSRILRISSPTSSPPSLASLNCSYSIGTGYIEHRVSKFDTLAGIAIKYGVEVADITKLNGLVTDLQMFALRSLRIPLPGRHPPSPCLSNDSLNHGEDSSEQASSSASNANLQDVVDSFQSLRLKPSETTISPAMKNLQGFYGLKPRNRRASEGLEMAAYKKEASHPQENHHRKSRSLVDAVNAEVNQSNAGVQLNSDKPVRRRQKSEADFTSQAPELLIKKENKSSSGGFSGIAWKGLALRSKAAASKTNLSVGDTEKGNPNSVPINLMDALLGDSFSNVRTLFSASSLQEPDCTSIWPTAKWSLTPELLAQAQAAMTSSIFDGLPLPLTGWRNKKAVD